MLPLPGQEAGEWVTKIGLRGGRIAIAIEKCAVDTGEQSSGLCSDRK